MTDLYLILLKINDVNVSLLPHDEAVQLFLNASDPIFLEVCRRHDFGFKQNDKDDCNITRNSQNELEKETTFKQEHHLHYVDDKLVFSPTTCETTHTPAENCKTTVCGSNAALKNSSPQKHPIMTKAIATTNTVKKQNLALYFPPPPPILQKSTGTDAEIGNWASNSTMRLVSPEKNLEFNKEIIQKNLQTGILEGEKASGSPKLISTAVQTDDNDFVHSLFHVTGSASTEAMIEREHNLFGTSLAPEIDIEEITLRKSDSNEHLGLTVLYSITGSSIGSYNASISNRVAAASEDNATCAEIYISNIQPDSIAGRDGRLRQGDQILQVNGKDVTNKKETETLIAENSNAVTLLVSRYLYADEDDFNGTCVSGLDIDDDEDEDDDDEYYDDNNMTYENCFITSSNCITEAETQLNRELIGTVTTTQAPSTLSIITDTVKLKTLSELNKNMVPAIPVSISTTKSSASSNKKIKSSSRGQLLMKYDPFQHQSIKAHLKQVNQELAMLDYRVQNMMVKPVATAINYDTEHIYETIPEDSESEPFYCSPYENAVVHPGPLVNPTECASSETVHLQEQKQRVAAWLRMQHTQRQHIANINNRNNTMLQYPQVISTWETSSVGSMVTSSLRSKSGTIKSAATTANASTIGSCSSGGGNICLNEHDNSSSAYNTGSNNSGTALTLVINSPHMRNIEQSDIEPLTAMRITKIQSHSPKDKLTSPKHQSSTTASLIKIPVPNETSVGAVHCASNLDHQAAFVSGIQQQLSTSTMYTNMANLQQTMLLQQQLFRNALMQQQQRKHFNFHLHQKSQPPPHQQNINAQSCTHFTTPNLSQYHFVSSQEVSAKQMRASAVSSAAVATAAKAQKNEEPMVWKVKRRQDGTRYIVRRPARTRILPDRTLGINAIRENHDLTTTEDDTISEIKTGRYWTREERKKHIERARERRQHHQQQLAKTAPIRICDGAAIHSGIKCQTPTSKEKLTKFINTTTLPNQPLQISHKLQIQSSNKLHHHKLQFSSMATSPTEISKQKQLPLATTTTSAGAAMTTNITATAADSSVDVVLDPRPDTTTATSLAKLDNLVGATGSGASTILPQPQTATTNEHKLVGLLSVTTV